MTQVERTQQAHRCAERVRKESELAKLEYQCEFLRGKWHATVASLARRGGHADTAMATEAKKLAAIIRVLEDRIRDAANAMQVHG